MGAIIGRIRMALGLCPLCGGNLKIIDHDCLKGDTYKCKWCGKEWVDA